MSDKTKSCGRIAKFAASLDIGKLFERSDLRNSAIGAALGAALLGTAGAVSDRDPEDDSTAVGDALRGALLGGIAGYAVPKGMSMFADASSTTKGGDPITLGGTSLGAGLVGANAASAIAGASRRMRAYQSTPTLSQLGKDILSNAGLYSVRSDGINPFTGKVISGDTRVGAIKRYLANLVNGHLIRPTKPPRLFGVKLRSGNFSSPAKMLGILGAGALYDVASNVYDRVKGD